MNYYPAHERCNSASFEKTNEVSAKHVKSSWDREEPLAVKAQLKAKCDTCNTLQCMQYQINY